MQPFVEPARFGGARRFRRTRKDSPAWTVGQSHAVLRRSTASLVDAHCGIAGALRGPCAVSSVVQVSRGPDSLWLTSSRSTKMIVVREEDSHGSQTEKHQLIGAQAQVTLAVMRKEKHSAGCASASAPQKPMAPCRRPVGDGVSWRACVQAQ